MSDQIVRAPAVPLGIDFALTQTGQPVRRALLEGFAQIIAHQWARRQAYPGLCVYQRDQSNTSRGIGATGDGWTWSYLCAPTTRWVRVVVIAVGATSASGVPQLICSSLADAGGELMDAVVDGAANFPANASLHTLARLEVTPGSVETITVEQNNGSSFVRVLAIGVYPIPRPGLDVVEDETVAGGGEFVGFDPYLFPAGENIVTENLVLAQALLAANRLRRMYRHPLFTARKEKNCTSAAFEDLVGGANRVQKDYMPMVTLPETADPAVSVKLYVLAVASGGGAPTGSVRLRNNAGQAITCAITGTLGVFSATASINRAASTWSYEALMSGTATNLRVLGADAVQEISAV